MSEPVTAWSPLRVVFDGVGSVVVETDHAGPARPGPGEVLVATDHSYVSVGSELACLSGAAAAWPGFPGVPGAVAVGTVTATGAGVDLPIGTQLLTDVGHRSFGVVPVHDGVCFPVPADVDPLHAPFAGAAMTALTALQVGRVELGDRVLVLGLGVPGQLVSQLLACQGATVTAVDPARARVEVGRACGLDAVGDVADLTGRRYDTVVDTTGRPAAVLACLERVVDGGMVVLLGTPWGERAADLAVLVRAAHRAGPGLTLREAHERIHPTRATVGVKHSLERTAEVVFDLLAGGILEVDPLISVVARPHEAPGLYRRLAAGDPSLVGVLFDWTRPTPW